jgi:hypothetical protein
VVVLAWLVELERMVQEQLYATTPLEYSRYGQSKWQPLLESLGVQNAFFGEFLMWEAKIVGASNEIHSRL